MKSLKILTILSIIALGLCVNNKPVIGILTQPADYPPYTADQYSYIFASYVKYIQSAGARVIAIPHDADQFTLDTIFEGINGILFPGGDANLDYDYIQPGSHYNYNILAGNAKYLFEQAKNATQNGDYFPIWGTCMGFQLLHILVNNFTSPLQQVANDVYFTRNLTYTKSSSQLYDYLKPSIKDYAEKVGAAFYNHHWAVYDSAYTKYPVFSQFFRITAHSFNGINQTYIAAVEANDYPIYGTQYHPQQNQYEWLINPNRSPQAIVFCQAHANFFVNEARKNNHNANDSWLQSYLIYNYNPLVGLSQTTNQIYIMPNIENGPQLGLSMSPILKEDQGILYHD